MSGTYVSAPAAPLRLLGLTGRAGAGKDTVAVLLACAGWRSVALADALRIEVAAAWGVDTWLFTHRPTKEHATPQLAVGGANSQAWLDWARAQGHSMLAARSPRWVMQQWGSFRRSSDPDHWIKHVLQWVHHQAHLHHGLPGLVVTDVRMANEASAVRQLGGRIVAVHRPDASALLPDTASHESEQGIEQLSADADIHNDGPLTHLGAEVWRVVGSLYPNP